MSIKSVFEKVNAFLKKVMKEEPKLDQVVSGTLTVITPLVETILDLAGQEAVAAGVGIVVSQVQTDLAAVNVLVQSSGTTPTITSILSAITANLKTILIAGQVKSPAALTSITEIVDLVITELETIAKALPKAVVSGAAS